MQKSIKIFAFYLAFIFTMLNFTSCSLNKNSNILDNENTISTDKDKTDEDSSNNNLDELYYYSLGYHKIIYNNDTEITCDSNNIIKLDNDTTMIKDKSQIYIQLKNKSSNIFYNVSDNYFNFITKTKCTGFNINNKFHSIENLATSPIEVKKDLTISSVYKKFGVVGIAAYCITPNNENSQNIKNNPLFHQSLISTNNGILSTKDNFLMYAYFNKFPITETNKTNIITNTTIDYNLSTINNLYNLEIQIEVFIETSTIYFYLITIDQDNNYALCKIIKQENESQLHLQNLNTEISNLQNIIISTSKDLSTT